MSVLTGITVDAPTLLDLDDEDVHSTIGLLDFGPDMLEFQADVLDGLHRPAKTLPCKYFYDARGSRLFDDICELPEYYPTRTELGIMRDSVIDISRKIGPGCRLVEYGSGSSTKTHILLDNLADLASYVPVDISRSHLMQSARRLSWDYPRITILPVCADYTRQFELPPTISNERTIVYFPGSTIGNFHPEEALAFLCTIAEQCGAGGGLLIGVDLKKNVERLHAAYNDARGVTAAFNLNLLARINSELAADFVLEDFGHSAFYNAARGRIEMHLVSKVRQSVHIGGEVVRFAEGETIHTECSYKYSIAEFADLAATAGFAPGNVWTDPDKLFSVHYLTVAG